jgi:hypothetical protein
VISLNQRALLGVGRFYSPLLPPCDLCSFFFMKSCGKLVSITVCSSFGNRRPANQVPGVA